MNCSRHSTNISFGNRFSTRWIVPGRTKIFHLGIVFHWVKDEVFQAHRNFHMTQWGSFFLQCNAMSCFKLSVAQPNLKIQLVDRFSTAMNCFAAPRKIFSLRIAFLRDELFQTQHIFPLGGRFSTRWNVPGRTTYWDWGSCFTEPCKKCSRQATYVHLRIALVYELFQVRSKCCLGIVFLTKLESTHLDWFSDSVNHELFRAHSICPLSNLRIVFLHDEAHHEFLPRIAFLRNDLFQARRDGRRISTWKSFSKMNF